MVNVILLEEEDIKRILREILDEYFGKNSISRNKTTDDYNEPLITNLQDIAKLFRCSLPTAQKIKNSVPKHLYSQFNKKFVISRRVLLEAHMRIKNQNNEH
jgi:hypothetical protein